MSPLRKRRDSNPRGSKPLIFQVLRYKPDSATFPVFASESLMIFEGIEPTFQTYQVCTLTVKSKNLK